MPLVGLFIDWLYTQRLPEQQLVRVKASIFGDCILAPTFRQAILDDLVSYMISPVVTPYYTAVILAFKNLPAGDPTLRLFIDAHCASYRPDFDTVDYGELQLQGCMPNAFLIGVMVKYAENMGQLKIDMDECDYHGHRDEEARTLCQARRSL
ncbi:hypothetical protein J1614_001757 [Plenodomus biglobosus]|nr:hypothetical protein J1614_001757 [Plenodomus biglobosus]